MLYSSLRPIENKIAKLCKSRLLFASFQHSIKFQRLHDLYYKMLIFSMIRIVAVLKSFRMDAFSMYEPN